MFCGNTTSYKCTLIEYHNAHLFLYTTLGKNSVGWWPWRRWYPTTAEFCFGEYTLYTICLPFNVSHRQKQLDDTFTTTHFPFVLINKIIAWYFGRWHIMLAKGVIIDGGACYQIGGLAFSYISFVFIFLLASGVLDVSLARGQKRMVGINNHCIFREAEHNIKALHLPSLLLHIRWSADLLIHIISGIYFFCCLVRWDEPVSSTHKFHVCVWYTMSTKIKAPPWFYSRCFNIKHHYHPLRQSDTFRHWLFFFSPACDVALVFLIHLLTSAKFWFHVVSCCW